MDQRRHAAHGPAARPPGADRVLGLLPSQLAAHASLRQGVGRALPRRRAAGDRRARLGASRPPPTPRRSAPPSPRLGIAYPVVVDEELQIWQDYGNLGWPARYLFNQEGRLFDYHYGEGGYDETEAAIQELLGVERPLLEPLRPEDQPGAVLSPQIRGRARPLQRPLRGGRGVGGARGRGHGRPPTATRSPSTAPAPTSSSPIRSAPPPCSSSRSARVSPATPSASPLAWPADGLVTSAAPRGPG